GGLRPCSCSDRLMRMVRIASGVAFIALFEPGDRFSGRNDWLVGVIRIGGAGKLVATNYTKQNQKEWNMYFCHYDLSFLFVKNDWMVLEMCSNEKQDQLLLSIASKK